MAMFRAFRPYLIALIIVSIALVIAAYSYAARFPVHTHWIMTGVLPAFVLEAACFLVVGFEDVRNWFQDRLRPAVKSCCLTLSVVLPFLVITAGSGTFDLHALSILFCLSALLSFWWILFPHRTTWDIGFLIVAAAPLVLKVFPRLYVTPEPKLQIEILGHAAWILTQRRFDLGPVSFWPKANEWREGSVQFLLSVVPASATALLLHFARFEPRNLPVLTWIAYAAGTFFGIMWFVALSEDIFRSVITRLFLRASTNTWIAIAGSAILFGCAHLWARDFPNWRYAIVAGIAHAFFTAAYLRAGSIRASMVAHALTVTLWRMAFRT
jgi:uncharacterized protein